nr:MAG TPA: hypothetical protein [Caudoviricetes sp.]
MLSALLYIPGIVKDQSLQAVWQKWYPIFDINELLLITFKVA